MSRDLLNERIGELVLDSVLRGDKFDGETARAEYGRGERARGERRSAVDASVEDRS